MKKPSWCEKHFKIRRAVSELQNSSSHFNRTALYFFRKKSKDLSLLVLGTRLKQRIKWGPRNDVSRESKHFKTRSFFSTNHFSDMLRAHCTSSSGNMKLFWKTALCAKGIELKASACVFRMLSVNTSEALPPNSSGISELMLLYMTRWGRDFFEELNKPTKLG